MRRSREKQSRKFPFLILSLSDILKLKLQTYLSLILPVYIHTMKNLRQKSIDTQNLFLLPSRHPAAFRIPPSPTNLLQRNHRVSLSLLCLLSRSVLSTGHVLLPWSCLSATGAYLLPFLSLFMVLVIFFFSCYLFLSLSISLFLIIPATNLSSNSHSRSLAYTTTLPFISSSPSPLE